MENDPQSTKYKCKSWCGGHGAGAGVYGLGLIGAAVYFLQHARTYTEPSGIGQSSSAQPKVEA